MSNMLIRALVIDEYISYRYGRETGSVVYHPTCARVCCWPYCMQQTHAEMANVSIIILLIILQ